jgi:hypothetical protein
MKLHISAILVVIVFFSNTVFAEMIPQELKKSVTFIFVGDNTGKLLPNGTGFFVYVEENKKIFSYLVTAKHVLLDKDGNRYKEIYIRLNTQKNSSEVLRIPFVGENAFKVYYHNDSSIDIAVIPLLPDVSKFDFRMLTSNMLTTKDLFNDVKIREGDDVFFTGLFTPYFGVDRNYPIFRFGKVALLTEEPIPWFENKQNQYLKLYLIEAQSYGGNSGSPVFFYLKYDRQETKRFIGKDAYLLAGIMKGYFADTQEIKIIDAKPVPISQQNNGIAAVVPAYFLHEIIFSDELVNLRKSSQ